MSEVLFLRPENSYASLPSSILSPKRFRKLCIFVFECIKVSVYIFASFYLRRTRFCYFLAKGQGQQVHAYKEWLSKSTGHHKPLCVGELLNIFDLLKPTAQRCNFHTFVRWFISRFCRNLMDEKEFKASSSRDTCWLSKTIVCVSLVFLAFINVVATMTAW